MGEVYRARDTRLGRDVAIKISHQQFNERFDREARAISALNHPNICGLYDVGPDYLVMEYVDGESPRGPMAADDVLAVAMQIAEALRAAHEKGIVHRDLKPANIKVTPDGTVKVLDFGLAKALDADSGAGEAGRAGAHLTQSPTITSPAMMTHAGMILGTAAYMAPEQARGKAVDARADIWAFGVVLYELLTGRLPFQGEDLTETLASVVKDPPDLSVIPARVRPLIESCLQKDPKKRLQSIGDAGLLLRDEASVESRVASRGFSASFTLGASATALVALAALGALAFVHFRERPPVARALRLSVPIPDAASPNFVELSPDGTKLVMQLSRQGTQQLFVRPLDSDDLQPLPGTTFARSPFWSPDSRFIGFFADGRLKVIPAAGGPVRALCTETGLGSSGSWSPQGVIIFNVERAPLRRVDAKGGECTPVGPAVPNRAAVQPVFLPDGEHFFYAGGDILDPDSSGVYLATLSEPIGRMVLEDDSAVIYVPPSGGSTAHLLFLRNNTIMSQPFDQSRLQIVGDPVPVVPSVAFAITPPHLLASASADGTLVYVSGRLRDSQLTWFDRAGVRLGTVGPTASQRGVLMSPDGNTAVITRRETTDIASVPWAYDLVRGSTTRLTPPGQSGRAVLWSRDGNSILLSMLTPGGPAWFRKDLTSGQQELVEEMDTSVPPRQPTDYTPDGKFMVYTVVDPKTSADVWYAPVNGGRVDQKAAVKILGSEASESQGQVSPDGKWLAYTSNETGAFQIHLRHFPTGTAVWSLSPERAQDPRWSADGKSLYFANTQGNRQFTVWNVSIEPDGRGALHVGALQKLFDTRATMAVSEADAWTFSPHPDGRRFLVNALEESGPSLVNVITDWRSSSRR
jgi:eukaryotic-like serine/threonine-protein kinase